MAEEATTSRHGFSSLQSPHSRCGNSHAPDARSHDRERCSPCQNHKAYQTIVPANSPVKQFCSVSRYDNVSRGLLITDQGVADLSSRKPDLVPNADESVDVTFATERPAGARNWINTTPGKGWFAYVRFFAPTEPFFAQTWQLNDIEAIQP